MRDSGIRKARNAMATAALITASLGGVLLFIIFVRTRFEFETSREPGRYFHIIGTMLVVSLVLGVIGLPKLESFIALCLFSLVGLFLVIMGYSIPWNAPF